MKVLSEEKIKLLADRNGWSPVYAEGFLDGENSRRRGAMPSKYAQVGIDAYSLGFRAGYYERGRPVLAGSGSSDAPIKARRKSSGRA